MTEPAVEPATETPDAEPETPTEQEANEVPDTELEPDGDQPETDEPADEPDEPDAGEEGISAISQGLTDKQLQVRDQKLDAENTRHAKRVGEIMDEDATDLIPCPVCMDGIAGWVYAPEAQALPEEAQLRLRQLLGLSGLEGIKQATFATTCPDCDGQGEVRTGSRVIGREVTTCERCMKSGWVRVDGAPAVQNGAAEPVPVVTGPTMVPVTDPDPEIQHLRERGFTVIPPMQIAGSGTLPGQ